MLIYIRVTLFNYPAICTFRMFNVTALFFALLLLSMVKYCDILSVIFYLIVCIDKFMHPNISCVDCQMMRNNPFELIKYII